MERACRDGFRRAACDVFQQRLDALECVRRSVLTGAKWRAKRAQKAQKPCSNTWLHPCLGHNTFWLDTSYAAPINYCSKVARRVRRKQLLTAHSASNRSDSPGTRPRGRWSGGTGKTCTQGWQERDDGWRARCWPPRSRSRTPGPKAAVRRTARMHSAAASAPELPLRRVAVVAKAAPRGRTPAAAAIVAWRPCASPVPTSTGRVMGATSHTPAPSRRLVPKPGPYLIRLRIRPCGRVPSAKTSPAITRSAVRTGRFRVRLKKGRVSRCPLRIATSELPSFSAVPLPLFARLSRPRGTDASLPHFFENSLRRNAPGNPIPDNSAPYVAWRIASG